MKCVRLWADAMSMLKRSPPMSNVERQRRFRERNPGYYGRFHARQRAAIDASIQPKRLAAAQQAAVPQRQLLMLPAPVELLEIPGLNAIPATMPVREKVAA